MVRLMGSSRCMMNVLRSWILLENLNILKHPTHVHSSV